MRKLLFLFIALLISGLSFGQVNLTASGGTLNGSYATLKDCFDAINAGTHTGTITIGISGNTTELAPAVLNASGTGSASYTSIAISPTGGAPRTISGAIAAGSPLIDFSGADNVTIDGINTGGNALTISNTTVSATSGTSTIRFIEGATNNTITNCDIQGSGTMSVATNGATIFFSTDAVTANGNDNNIISYCNIGPAGANLPTKAILGNGSTTTPAIGNSGNVINNNNIYDYFGAAVSSSGIATNGGCNTWTITNNRFYQTGARTWTASAAHRAIDINNTTTTSGAQGFTITGNIIGYASNSQTGTYTLTGAFTSTFRGIHFNGITAGIVSNINSNTIASVSMTGVTSSGTSSGAPMMGIYIGNGTANTNSNTIGSQSATGSLVFSTTSPSAADIIGMMNFSIDAWTANTNNIGGLSSSNLGVGAANAYGLRLNTASAVITTMNGNIIGGTVANSIQSTSTAAGAQVAGIYFSTSIAVISGNTIRNLTAAGGTGTTTAASVVGIDFISATPINTASQNTIYNLTNTNATAATVVTGIQFTGGIGNIVERNYIYGLTTSTNSAIAEVNGIRVAGGTTIYRNNMIALGAGITNAIGAAASNMASTGITGITEFLGTNSFFHNSVYIGGNPTAGTGASYAFNGTQTVNTRSFRDNIFENERSNSGATGKNYAVKINGTAANPAGLTINNNVYYGTGSGFVFGFFNSLDVADLAAWKTAVGQDAASFQSNPQYLDPTNTTPDLHLHPTNATVAEGNGVDVGITADFDGQTRASYTPVDIGADAGNFSGMDLSAPSITYTTLSNTSLTSNRIISATIADVTGVATGGLAPRIYFNKNAGAYFSTAATLSSGTVQNGVWSCTIDNALLGGVVVTDVIRYFVVAQDVVSTPNVGGNPSSGLVLTDVNTITTAPTTPNSYTIVPTYAGTINVGATETFTSLTNAGGIFEAINAGVISGNVTISITSDLTTELGTNALNQWSEDGVGGYTMLIKPSGAARIISGTNAGALIRFNGVDRVTIDGSITGASAGANMIGGDAALRELTIQNTNVGTSAVVISFGSGTNGTQNNTIKNVNILGQDPTTTLAGITLGGNTPGTAGTDNDNNSIENCSVKRAIYGIYSAGLSLANQNTGTVIKMNDLSALTTDRVRRVGIVVFNDNGIQITENSVAVETNESADAVGIGVGCMAIDNASTTAGGVTNALVSNNKINGIASLSATGFSAAGIAVAGAVGGANIIRNNMITGVTAPATSPDLVAGIFVTGAAGSDTRLYFNSVSMTGDRGVVATQTPSFGIAITGTDPTVELKNNIFYTTQIASGGGVNAKSYAIGMVSTSFANLNSNYNNFWSAGANDGGFRTGSLGAAAGTDYAAIAPWAVAVSDDANSLEVTPVFAGVADLHLSNTLGDNWCLSGSGVNIPGITTDYDGQTRNSGLAPLGPDMGADEFTAVGDAAATPLTQTICTGTSITTIALSGTATSFNWTRDNTVAVTGLATSGTGDISGTLTNTTSSPVTVTFTITPVNANGCFGPSITATVTVNPIVTAGTVSGLSPVCIGDTPTYTSNGTAGGAWTSLTPAVASVDIATGVVTALTAGTADITYTVNVGCGSPVASFKTITVNPLPIPALSGNNDVCQGTTGEVYITDGSMTTYDWTVSAGGTITAGGTSTDNTVTITWNTAGAQTVSVNYENGSGCTAAAATDFNVTVNALPVPTITGLSNVCAGTTGVVYSTDPGMTNYSWNVSAGGTITGGGTSSDYTVTVSWLTAGNETISINYTDGNGCTAAVASDVNLIIGGAPVVWLGNDTTICANQSIMLDAGNPGSSWLWSEGGATSQTITVDSLGHGMGTVQVWVAVDNGCIDRDTILITFDPCTGIDENNNESIAVYPNPTEGIVYISTGGYTDLQVNLTTVEGRSLFNGKANELNGSSDLKQINLSKYATGVYFIRLTEGDMVKVVKIIKQ